MKLNIFPTTIKTDFTTHKIAFHPYFINLYKDSQTDIAFVEEYDENQNSTIYDEFIKKFKHECLKNGVSEENFNLHLKSIDIESSKKMKYGTPVFVPILPLYCGPNDWIIEIEDGWNLFYPHAGHAENSDYDLTSSNWVIKILKVLFEMDNCKQILTHMKDSINFIEKVFGEKVLGKTSFLQQSVDIPDNELKLYPKKDNFTTFLFHGGSVHTPEHFFLRGGLETLNAFINAYKINKNIHLKVVYDTRSLNNNITSFMKNHPGITYYEEWQSDEQMKHHRQESDVFLIPAFRIHCMSTLMSLARGNPVICSDGWGFDEYVYNNYTGLIAKGQKCSWKDDNGLFRESYTLGRGILQYDLMKNVENSILKISTNLNLYNNLRMNCVNEYCKNYTNDTRNQVLSRILNNLNFKLTI